MSFVVRAATAADRPEVVELIREMIPGSDADARVSWLYERNPAGRALTWIAIENGEVAGCTSFFPFRLWLDGEEVLGALGGDGYVHERFRRRGLGGLLHDASRQAMTELGIGCMYGAPGAMNLTPLKRGGSREIGQVARWVRPLCGSAIGIDQPLLDRIVRVILRPRFVPSLAPMVPNDPRVDAVWRKAAPAIRLGAIRDSAFYTWRFLDAPAHREPAFVIQHAGEPIGACSLEVMRGGHEVRIVDLITAPKSWSSCLAGIARYAAASDARTVDIKLMATDGRMRRMWRMWRAGFIERERKPFLVMIPTQGDPRFLDPERWFYSGADSDLDTLE
ncbi:MAG: GNAT family N-acetyltransferase [Kofleriaceae bacterium]